MKKNLEVTLSVDDQTGDVTAVRNSFDKLDKKVSQSNATISNMKGKIAALVGTTAVVYGLGKAFGFLVRSGYDYNRSMDASTAKLTAMISASKGYVTVSGEQVSAQRRQALIASETAAMMDILEQTNAETSMGMSELIDVYALAKPGMDQYNWAVKDQIEIVKLASNTASTFGMSAEELSSGIDDLAAGTWEASSGFGKMMKSIKVSKAAYQAAGDKVAYLKEKMKETGEAQDTMAVATSNFQVAWDKMAGQVSQPLFDGVKKALTGITVQMNKSGPEAMQVFADALVDMVNGGMKAMGFLAKVINQVIGAMQIAYAGYQKYAGLMMGGDVEEAISKLEALKKRRDSLSDVDRRGNSTSQQKRSLDTLISSQEKVIAQYKEWNDVRRSGDKNHEEAQARVEAMNRLIANSVEKFNIGKNLVDPLKDALPPADELANKITKICTGLNTSGKKPQQTQKKDEIRKDDFKVEPITLEFRLKGFNDVTSAFADIGNAMLELSYSNASYQKDLSKTIAGTKERAQAEAKYTLGSIGAYSNMATAMTGFYDEDDDRKKKQQKLSEAIHLVNMGMQIASMTQTVMVEGVKQQVMGVTALAAQLQLPFPANIPAFALVAGMLASLGIAASGGGGSSSSPEESANLSGNQMLVDNTYAPITDRLDKQIDLLAAIELQGSAASLKVDLAESNFNANYAQWKEDVLSDARLYAWSARSAESLAKVIAMQEAASGVDIYYQKGEDVGLNTQVLRQDDNMISALRAIIENPWGLFGQAGIENWDDTAGAIAHTSNMANFTDLQNIVADWALGVQESFEAFKDAGEDFKSYFDSITDGVTYSTLRLEQAFSEVAGLKNNTDGFEAFLQSTVDNMETLKTSFSEENFRLLQSNDMYDIEAQIALVKELGVQTGQAFDGGAKEALNYLESIELVAEAMATSKENTKEYLDTFKTEQELTEALASALNVSVASTFAELDMLFQSMSNDLIGLTDDEAEFLTMNQEMLRTMSDTMNGAIDQYIGYQNTFSDVDSMIDTVSPDTLKNFTQVLDDAYSYEVGLLNERHDTETQMLQKQLSAVESLEKFSSALYYDNQTELTRYKVSASLLDNSLALFDQKLVAGEDTSDVLTQIQKYSEDYIRYSSLTAGTDADYNFAVASLQNKLQNAAGVSDIGNQDLSDQIRDKLEYQTVALENATDALKLVSIGKLSEVKEQLLGDSRLEQYQLEQINSSFDISIASLEDLLGADNYIVQGIRALDGNLETRFGVPISAIYDELLNTAATSADIAYWTNTAVTYNMTALELARSIAEAATEYGQIGEAAQRARDFLEEQLNTPLAFTLDAIDATTTLSYISSTDTQNIVDTIAYSTLSQQSQTDVLETWLSQLNGSMQDNISASENTVFTLESLSSEDTARIVDALSMLDASTRLSSSVVATEVQKSSMTLSSDAATYYEGMFEAVRTGTQSIVDALDEQTSTLAVSFYDANPVNSIVDGFYTDILGREADKAGANYWKGELLSGGISTKDLYQSMANASKGSNENIYYEGLKAYGLDAASSTASSEASMQDIVKELQALRERLENIEAYAAKTAKNTGNRAEVTLI